MKFILWKVFVIVGCAAVALAGERTDTIASPPAQQDEQFNVKALRALDAEGGFIRLEANSLFLTSDGRKSEKPGYWLDVRSDPVRPRFLSDSLPPAWDIAIDRGHAFVCDYEKFLTVYRIQGERWELVGKLDMPSMTENVILRDKLAYVANHTAGLTVVDISKNATPSIVSSFNPKIDCDAVGLSGEFAVLYGHWESQLVLADVSDPKRPRRAGAYRHTPKTFNQGELAIDDGVAYCTAVTGLVIVDIRNPAAPKLLKDVKLEGATTDVVITDGFAFVAAGRHGVLVFDVNAPGSPVRVGCYRSRKTLAASQLAVRRVTPEDGDKPHYVVYVANKRGPAMVLSF